MQKWVFRFEILRLMPFDLIKVNQTMFSKKDIRDFWQMKQIEQDFRDISEVWNKETFS